MSKIRRPGVKSVSAFLAALLFTVSVLPAVSMGAADASAPTAKSASVKPDPKKTAAPARPLSRKPLDRNEILSLYLSGEFETLVALLENIRRERQLRDREDSVFIYKFLGVIYGANDNTRRKAESFLYQMLKLDPQEDLSSLGVGDSVEAIFDRVRMRFAKVHDDSLAALGIKPSRPATPPAIAAAPAPSAPAAAPPATAHAASEPRRSVPGWVWITGGGVAAAALVTTLVLVNQQPDPHVHTISDTLR